MGHPDEITAFIAHWRGTGGSELANTQSFINGLCALIGVALPHGSKADDTGNDYVFERRVFQDNGDGTQSFGRIDCYKRDSFILEAKQGSDADRVAADRGDADLDLFGQTATARMKRGTARRGTPGWAKAMVQAKGQAERYRSLFLTAEGRGDRMEYDLTLEECLLALFDTQETDEVRGGEKRPWHCNRQPEGYKLWGLYT